MHVFVYTKKRKFLEYNVQKAKSNDNRALEKGSSLQ